MLPALIVSCAWLLFGGSHLLLARAGLRERIVDRLGRRGFTLLFAGVTVATGLVLTVAVARWGGAGRAGVGSALPGAVHVISFAACAGGATLATAGLMNYPRSPMAALARARRAGTPVPDARVEAPSAVERVARHPFFAGLAIMTGAHALLADTLAGALHFAGFAIFVAVGIPLQDRKLRARWGEAYAGFERRTSSLPFRLPGAGAAVAGWRRWPVAVVATLVVFGALHPLWMQANGAPFIAVNLLFGLVGVAKGLMERGRSPGRPPP